MKLINQAAKYGTGLAATLGSALVMAQSAPAKNKIDLTPITSQFTAGDVITAVMAVAAVLATIYVTMKAAKIALGWIRGG